MSAPPVALTVPLRACVSWCTDGDGHPTAHPEDRRCWSEFEILPLTHRYHRPGKYTDGTWVRPYLNVYLRRDYDSEEGHVVIHSEETDKELILSRTEALDLIAHMAKMVDRLDDVDHPDIKM